MNVDDETSTTSPLNIAFRVVHVEEILFDFATSTAAVVLREAEGARRQLTLPVALGDATALHQAWRRVVGRRPSTSELVTLILQELHADVIATRIVREEGGVYYGELDLMTSRGRRVFDCRPSDAMGIALRQGYPAPLLVADELLGSI